MVSCSRRNAFTYHLNNLPNSGLTDQDAAQLGMTPTDKADLLEEIITEISVYFGMLYLLVEVFKGHSDFADELSTYDYHSDKPTFYTPSSEPRSSFTCLLVPSGCGTPR